MKIDFLLFSLLVGLAVGCGEKSEPASGGGSGGGSVISAPTDYLSAAAKAQKSAVKTIDTAALNTAIQLFGGEQGRYPKDLNELVEKKYLKEIPAPPHGMEIQYDAKAGSVKIVTK